MRCFVAVTVPSRITEAMARELPGLQAAAERCESKISWARPEGWHVTLKFLGEVGEERSSDVCDRLKDVAPRHEPFRVEAPGLLALPEHKRAPSVIAVALRDDERLARLAGDVDEALSPAGFAREGRPFRPHVTFGRVRNPRGWRCFEQALAPLMRTPLGEGEVGEMVFYRSRLGDGPARYEVIESFPLGAASGQDARRATERQASR